MNLNTKIVILSNAAINTNGNAGQYIEVPPSKKQYNKPISIGGGH